MSEDFTRAIQGLNAMKAAMAGEQRPRGAVVGRLVFGKAADCDVRVDDDYVSPHHCAIEQEADGSVWVEDLGSTNGTHVRPGLEPVRPLAGYGARVIARRRIFPPCTVRIGKTDIPWRTEEQP